MKKFRKDAYRIYRQNIEIKNKEILIYHNGDITKISMEELIEEIYHQITIENDTSVGKKYQYYVDKLHEASTSSDIIDIYKDYIEDKQNGDFFNVTSVDNPNIDDLLEIDSGLIYDELKHLTDEQLEQREDEEEFIHVVKLIRDALN